ncbi:M23 family metallopeptidase [Fervidibacillus halotolerans]|uniref:M23 family metallopeptidase n=1 Tax=Fervidibacillus halotolerans TaxID=2980027 RepID=UPI0023B27446|nr:M23 family metallopeptidase [Fervidibacillus halotolerans]
MQNQGNGRKYIGLLFFIAIGLTPTDSSAQIDEVQGVNWIWPTNGFITDIYGTRNGSHKGIDIAEKMGTEVVASFDGTITRSYYSHSYGNVVFIKHDVGFESVYAHLSKRLVKKGDRVKQGEIIGLMGNTGHSSGSHLHFEIHRSHWTYSKENAMDPLSVFGEAELGEYVFCGENGRTNRAVTKK